MATQAVIFDLDGTLLDTLEDIGCAMNRVLACRGLPQYPLDRYRLFVGDGAEVLVRRALPAGQASQSLVGQCLADFKAAYAETWNVLTKPYPGIPELLDALKKKGMPMAILSNKPDDFTVRCVEAYLPQWSFGAVLGEQPGRPRKPDSAGALEIARRLSVPPRDIVYVGDTATDMQTAVAAGMMPVGVRWGFRPAEEMLAAGAQHLIETPLELLTVFKKVS